MRGILIVFLSIISVMEVFSQNRSTDRRPVAAGTFYEADKGTLTSDIIALFAGCKKSPGDWKVRAIICPHAGYIFSGKIAASAISTTPKDADYKNIFIIGSSHVMAFDGASVYNIGDFITPLGKAVVNKEIANKLKSENKVFEFPVTAHMQDHCLEVEIPLIQYYYSRMPMIVPIIIGTNNVNTVKRIADALKPYFTPDNLFLISSDFSHYPSYKDAVNVDNLTARSIVSGNPEVFLTTLRSNSAKNIPGLATSMCGWTSGLTLLDLAEGNKNLEFRHIDYCNSGDTPYGDKDRVVGYNAIALIEKNQKQTAVEESSIENLSFTGSEKDMLFSIARNSIRTMLYDNKRYSIDTKKIPDALKKQYGAFVTLKIDGKLRGCIGRFQSTDPLYEVVQASALSSAFEDHRFYPLTKEEYEKVNAEITILGPMKRISNINEIVLGKHGIYIKKDFRTGTMLPQVAIENGWTVEQFLSYTSRDKAGLGWDGWKNAELYIYEGMVLEENKK
jgi:AmmeMemoRadiSam system protein B/AmmeMemoRadiSam system protein A